MQRAKVSITRVHDYDRAQVYSAVERGVSLIGGLETVVKPGSRVFVKINHLSPASAAEKGIVTHPVFVEAVLELLKRAGAEITVGDDIETDIEDGFEISGFRQMCDKAGVRLINLKETGFVEVGCQGHILNRVYLSSTVLEADVIINLPKLKTHSLTLFTGGVKNMYGVIPHGLRNKFHGQYINVEDFSHMLVDVYAAARPHLTIMDGIMAMEGEGPSDGDIRKVGVVLVSHDAVALDTVATRIIGVDPIDVYTTRFACERELGIGSLDDVEVVGERLEDVAVSDFRLPTSVVPALSKWIPGFLSSFVQGRLAVKPRVVEGQCTLCLACEEICPAAAIIVNETVAKVDDHRCIACMCCHEVCRFHAITLTRPITGRVIYSLVNIIRKLRHPFAGIRTSTETVDNPNT